MSRLLHLLALSYVSCVVRTPFGIIDDGCSVEVPHGTTVSETSRSLLLSHPELGAWEIQPPEHCAIRGGAARSNVTCSNLPCNSWIDNAGFMRQADAKPLGGFSANYQVPETPAKRAPGQTLFYFIGAENTDGTPRHGQPPPSGRAILQPVLTFDPDGWCKASKTGWCFASWYCCPKSITVHAPYVQDVTPFDTFITNFSLTAASDEFEVTGQSITTKLASTLRCPRQGRNFNCARLPLPPCPSGRTTRVSFKDHPSGCRASLSYPPPSLRHLYDLLCPRFRLWQGQTSPSRCMAFRPATSSHPAACRSRICGSGTPTGRRSRPPGRCPPRLPALGPSPLILSCTVLSISPTARN